MLEQTDQVQDALEDLERHVTGALKTVRRLQALGLSGGSVTIRALKLAGTLGTIKELRAFVAARKKPRRRW